MKKQFNRMKQLANQTVGRAEKTEVLSDDLLQIERRMELVRVVSHNTHKKMVSCLQGHIGAEAEKRHSVPRLYTGNGQKKLPLTALSQAMVEGGTQLGEDSLMGKMMEVCGEVENRLATELMQHELQMEKEVLDPLSQLAEVEIPNILKQRKQLAKLVLDYDSARARWLQATKSIISGTNTQALTAKADLLKEEVDEAMNKVELCKDQLAADMYTFFSKEGDYAHYFITLLEAQADYHRKSLSVLESVLPAIRAQQDSWIEKPAFGTALDDHLKRSGRQIAVPMEACVMMLLETGMKEEGLFRIAAGASKLKKLKAALDCSTSQLEEFYSDPHAVAGALKSYLRELPDPLMTSQLYDEWIQASSVSDPDKRLQALWLVCDKLPKNNRNNLRYLVKFLARLAQDSETNKMTPSNMAIVLGPNLLWAKTEGSLAEMAAATSVHVVAIIEPIIQHADWFFPEDVEFNVSGMFVMPPPAASNHSSPPDADCSVERKRSSMLGADADATRRDNSLKLRDCAVAAPTPVPQRNGSGGGGSSGTGSMGPSPHTMRRGTKKQAPPPPKPSNPPPSQPVAPPSSCGPASPPPCAAPRRHSNNQPPLHAPNHPPPAPPAPGPQPWTDPPCPEPEPSPPGTPSPPDSPPTPPACQDAVPPPTQSGFGSLPRPRPVPKPRNRPSMPPPPQPPALSGDTNGVCKMAEPLMSLKRPGQASVPELTVDQQLTAANSSSSSSSSCDLDTESTAL
ncbi:rho GTPase-activating protein 17a isoform X3 [Xiphophorus couchianus]|uniref:rho GTPase-activating protein 17a isoform X3 n=1 Tax=Xiphophorus couchianus TaxID=32473 RepID=UPI001015F479|nr:rho GTPase-activating protein 17 isoform X3 [Xiphophorus couchianus]